jgi:hypothetical protein
MKSLLLVVSVLLAGVVPVAVEVVDIARPV